MPYNHTATGSPNERELTPEEYRQLNREIQEMRMTNELLKRLRVDYISEITIGDVHDAADEITQLRGNLGLAEDGLASATQEIEQLRARLNHLEFAITQAADSFKDLKVSQHLLGHPVIGETCARAERVMRSLLAGSKPTPDEPIEALPHASEALKQFMSELGEIMGMEDGTKPADYLQRAQDIRQWCSDHQTLPPWIPITERVPEPEVLVLCWDGYKTFVEWFGNKPDAGRGVTHWVPYQMPPGAVSNMHEGRRAFADGPEKRAEPSEPLDKKSFERNCGHYHFQDYCDECNRVWSLIESCTPRQEAAERRWLLLAHILDESAETGKLPSGLHEAFQMGGDAMAEWLDRRAAEKSGALQNHPDYDPVCPQGHRCTKDARSIWQCILCQWIAQP